jgi:Cu/Ag efflux pump CusA
MNKSTIIGIALLLICILLYFSFENDITDLLIGFCSSGGIILLLSGLLKNKPTNT